MIHETDSGYLQEGCAQYLQRLQRFIPVEVQTIVAQKKWNQLSVADRKQAEGERMLSLVQAQDQLYLLDERGKQMSSVDFAAHLNDLLSFGAGNLLFAIGGAHGFSPEVYARANGKLSLSKMTFTHQMIRLLFFEQLYRAMTILHHHPYHNE